MNGFGSEREFAFSQELLQNTIGSYIVYLVIAVAMCIWVARTLRKNGEIFLVEAFLGNEKLARSINHLLVVGFYLINLGYILLVLRLGSRPDNLMEAFEVTSARIGGILLVLGMMHFFNLFVFSIIRRSKLRKQALPPPYAAQV